MEHRDGEIQRSTIGRAEIRFHGASSILTKASGFMDSYDYTLNPYAGCSFGCSYCYAAFFSRSESDRNNWGHWVQVKENALELLKKKRKKPLVDKTIYMSSVTDPYQPIEKELELTRNVLQELAEHHEVRLVIQTRSALVVRDIDLFKRFKIIQINMTVTTDSEEVRKAFEPNCPANHVRLNGIRQIHEAGIDACITMTPLLPVLNASEFAASLLQTGVSKFVVQPFHAERGNFVAGTREKALEIIERMNWDSEKYFEVESELTAKIPGLTKGKDGFKSI